MNALKDQLGITGKQKTFTQTIQKPKHYNKVKDNTLLKEDYNFMADLLFLPKTKEGYLYLFVIVDLATDEFDYEPLTGKTPSDIVKAIYAIDKRSYFSISIFSYTEESNIYHQYIKEIYHYYHASYTYDL